MPKGQKKPWSRVGKLEARIKQLEETIERRHRHYCVDFEELTNRDNEIREHFNREIKEAKSIKERMLSILQDAVTKILKGE